MSIKFSIIIPTYNRAHLLSKAIDSVVEQTYPFWELIIIDDGSTDNTAAVVNAYDDKRIKYHWQENQERSVARNNGFQLSTGDWICFLDSDDWYQNEYLERLSANILENDTLIRTRLSFVNEDGETTYVTANYNGLDNQQWFIHNDIDSVLSYAFKREILEKYSFYNIPSWEDKDLLTRVFNDYCFKALDYTSVCALAHEHRSINTFHRRIHVVKKVLDRIKIVLAAADHLSKKQQSRIYSKYIFSLLYNAVNDPETKSLSYMKNINALSPKYVFRWMYYMLKKKIR